jgi:deaminated glutathione amidase
VKTFRVAVVQMKSSELKADNLSVAIENIHRAADNKANAICFPEFLMGYSPAEQDVKVLSNTAETVNRGKFVAALRRAARINNIPMIATIYEKSDTFVEQRVYDTAVMIDSRGKISSVYRKLHLYDALGFKESAKFIAGDKINKPVMFGSARVGIMICYDIRFPEMSRILAGNGADVLIVPSAWVHGILKEEHWQTMLKARAIENGSFVIAPDQVGNIYTGRSMIIDPFGVVLLDMGNREGMEIVDIDTSRVRDVRASLPLLENRRTDVYRNNLDIFCKNRSIEKTLSYTH